MEVLEELGFVSCACAHVNHLDAVLGAQLPDLIIVGLSSGEVEAPNILKMVAAKSFEGKVLLHGSRTSGLVATVQEFRDKLAIAMLPALHTPFSEGDLRERVALLLPTKEPPDAPIHVAMHEGLLELWYQPEIDTRTFALQRAEGLIRMRHPTWGIISPAYFIPDDGDLHFRGLSNYVIAHAIAYWRYFVAQQGSIDIAINLPIAFFRHSESVKDLCKQMPAHPAFNGLIIEIKSTEAVRNLELLKDVARQFRSHKVAISIDNLGPEWPLLAGLHDFPFVEIKVNKKYVIGCASDLSKQTFCRQILAVADGYGAHTVAQGVDTQADFLAVREMGFNKAQGVFFGRAQQRGSSREPC